MLPFADVVLMPGSTVHVLGVYEDGKVLKVALPDGKLGYVSYQSVRIK